MKEVIIMQKVKEALVILKDIENAYGQNTENIEMIEKKIANAKVCTPIIGKFSSGKSALINALLGYSNGILKVDIMPETAIPAEITYGDEDNVTIIKNDGSSETMTVSEYREYKADANTIKCARLTLRNSFLEDVQDVVVVDMPGFDSGFEVHNKAIDSYLPESMAYMVAFPADDMIIRSSIGNTLREICLHDMPVCIVITKGDKKKDDYEDSLADLLNNIKRFIGDREIPVCFTNSADGDTKEVENFLCSVQENSQALLRNRFKIDILNEMNVVEGYLKTAMENNELSESDLDAKAEKLNNQYSKINRQMEDEKERFEQIVPECIDKIKADVMAALESEEPNLVVMAMNNQNINDRLNITVRVAVTKSVQSNLVPEIEKHLRKVANCINSEKLGDVDTHFEFNLEQVKNSVVTNTVAAISMWLVAGPILGLVGYLITEFIGKKLREKKREEQKNEVRAKLHNEIFPQIIDQVGNNLDTAIYKQINMIKESIDETLKRQKETLEQAIEDIRKQKLEEDEKKKNSGIDVKNDLERIEEIRNELQ